jgi:hypothetical protein
MHNFLQLICALVTEMEAIGGGLQEHLSFLKEHVMGVLPQWEDATLEQKIVLRLQEALKSIRSGPLVQNMSARYFAENLRAMLQDYEQEVEETDELTLNTIRLTNINPYKYCFFPMFEADKVPRRRVEAFPFSREILEILQSPKFGIERVPQHCLTIADHIALEEHHFKNVLDFTTEQLTFTMAEKEDERRNSIAHYGHDIATLFDSDIPWQYAQAEAPQMLTTAPTEQPKKYLSLKEQYTLLELLMFYLCPRRFLHQREGAPAYTSKFQLQFYFVAVLFSETLKAFCRYNRANKKIYSVDHNTAAEEIQALLPEIHERYLPYFPIFTPYELSDLRRSVVKRLADSVSDMRSRGIESERFTVLDVPERPVFALNGFALTLGYDTMIYDLDKKDEDGKHITRASQNDVFLHFLALKTQKDKKGWKSEEEEKSAIAI